MRSMFVIQSSQCPVAIMSACGLVGWIIGGSSVHHHWWVGGLDVKANFVPKIDIVGLVRIVLLDGREPLFLKIM